MKIAIIGSAETTKDKNLVSLCGGVGKYLEEKDISILTGGCDGIPGLIVKSCNSKNIIAYSPDIDEDSHNLQNDNLNSKYFSEMKFIQGFTARSLKMIEDSDAIILIGGRIGTLSEFTIALEEGKKVLVIKDSGCIADHLEYILQVANKEFPDQIIFEKDYKKGIDRLVEMVGE